MDYEQVTPHGDKITFMCYKQFMQMKYEQAMQKEHDRMQEEMCKAMKVSYDTQYKQLTVDESQAMWREYVRCCGTLQQQYESLRGDAEVACSDLMIFDKLFPDPKDASEDFMIIVLQFINHENKEDGTVIVESMRSNLVNSRTKSRERKINEAFETLKRYCPNEYRCLVDNDFITEDWGFTKKESTGKKLAEPKQKPKSHETVPYQPNEMTRKQKEMSYRKEYVQELINIDYTDTQAKEILKILERV